MSGWRPGADNVRRSEHYLAPSVRSSVQGRIFCAACHKNDMDLTGTEQVMLRTRGEPVVRRNRMTEARRSMWYGEQLNAILYVYEFASRSIAYNRHAPPNR